MFYVYLLRNLVNGKVYVGKTGNLYNRLHSHLSISRLGANNNHYIASGQYNLIHKAIFKYGAEQFEFITLGEYETEAESLACEIEFIRLHKSNVNRFGKQFGYNLTDGGEGTSGKLHSEESKNKIRKKAIGRYHSEETKLKMSKDRSGDGCKHNKLTWDDVEQIRKSHGDGDNYSLLAKKFNISKTMARMICLNLKWKL